MTATLPTRTTDPLAAAAAYAPTPGTPRRRSPAMVSLGIVLVVVCALAAWEYANGSRPTTRSYLAVFADVPAGAQIAADDLQMVSLSPVAGLTPIRASAKDRIVGQYATVHLLPGTLLTEAAVSPQRTVVNGNALIGVSLTATQRPARALSPGDHVRLVQVPDPNGSGGDTSTPALPALVVTVADVGAISADDGSEAIDLQVPLENVSAVAALAAISRLAVVLVNGE